MMDDFNRKRDTRRVIALLQLLSNASDKNWTELSQNWTKIDILQKIFKILKVKT